MVMQLLNSCMRRRIKKRKKIRLENVKGGRINMEKTLSPENELLDFNFSKSRILILFLTAHISSGHQA